MSKSTIKNYIRHSKIGQFFAGAALFGLLSGCKGDLLRHTSPNIPHVIQASPSLDALKQHNALLYIELQKLPEMQNGESAEERVALEKLTVSYFRFHDRFDRMFAEMYKTGKPDVREYCSPLEALFWLYEDGKIQEAESVIKDYDLEHLLDIAWYSPMESYKLKGRWYHAEAKKLFDSCIDAQLKEQIVQYSKENPMMGDPIAIQYTFKMAREHPQSFGYKHDDSAFDREQDKNKARWKDFNVVMARLNAPLLLNYYINNNMHYVRVPMIYTPLEVFNAKEGDCGCMAFFGKRALNQAGYDTYVRGVVGPSDTHAVLVRKEDGKFYIDVNFTEYVGKKTNLSGPYKSEDEVIKEIGIVTGGVTHTTIMYQRTDSVFN